MRPPGLCTVLLDDRDLSKMPMDTTETHAPHFESDIHGGNDVPTTTDQNVSTKPDTIFQPDFKSSGYQLLSLLSDRSPPECISSIPYECSLAHQKR